ncbi:Fur family transcriptional regulator [Variovorax sp. HJSM1_2]|uniref:Fur family transcriptional regulator n=1 Tax=Variovorax sp. HJSM1_2 TaxID=3366263 RepID=UPI003BD28651
MRTETSAVDDLLARHGLRRTAGARAVLGWLLDHADTSYTHAELQDALTQDGVPAVDRVTLYRLVDRMAQAGLLLSTVDAQRVRHYQAMNPGVDEPTMVAPHFECRACHRDLPLTPEAEETNAKLEAAAKAALKALEDLGHHGVSLDLSMRGVCSDCTPSPLKGHAPNPSPSA